MKEIYFRSCVRMLRRMDEAAIRRVYYKLLAICREGDSL